MRKTILFLFTVLATSTLAEATPDRETADETPSETCQKAIDKTKLSIDNTFKICIDARLDQSPPFRVQLKDDESTDDTVLISPNKIISVYVLTNKYDELTSVSLGGKAGEAALSIEGAATIAEGIVAVGTQTHSVRVFRFGPRLPGLANITIELIRNPKKDKDSRRKTVSDAAGTATPNKQFPSLCIACVIHAPLKKEPPKKEPPKPKKYTFEQFVPHEYVGALRVGFAVSSALNDTRATATPFGPGGAQRIGSQHDIAIGEVVMGYTHFWAKRDYLRNWSQFAPQRFGTYFGLGVATLNSPKFTKSDFFRSLLVGVDYELHRGFSIGIGVAARRVEVQRADLLYKVGDIVDTAEGLNETKLTPSVFFVININPAFFEFATDFLK